MATDDEAEEREAHRVAVMLVTGFLGSGKTTLLNQVLRKADRGTRVAAIVNEIGAVDVDGQLVEGNTGRTKAVRLPNGCVCCTMQDDLVQAVKDVLDRNRENLPEYLLIETTGVADPEPIVLILRQQPLVSLCYLDSIITVVDCDNFQEDMLGMKCFANQIIAADVILLNKVDLVKEDGLHSLEEYFYEKLRKPRLIKCTDCNVSLSLIMHTGIHLDSHFHTKQNLQHELPHPTDKRNECHRATECTHTIDSPSQIPKSTHLHDDGFCSISATRAVLPSLYGFQAFLSALPATVVRMKGFVRFSSMKDSLFEVHLCGARYTSKRCMQRNFPSSYTCGIFLVLIGRNLDKEWLEHLIEMLCQAADLKSIAQPLSDEASCFLAMLANDVRLRGRREAGQVVTFTLSGWFGPKGSVVGCNLNALNMQLAQMVSTKEGVFITCFEHHKRLVLCYEFGAGGFTGEGLYRAVSRACIDILMEGLMLAELKDTPKEVAAIQDEEVNIFRRQVKF
eukprot:scaffold102_cov340-Pavlova_lutheri.AAC.84